MTDHPFRRIQTALRVWRRDSALECLFLLKDSLKNDSGDFGNCRLRVTRGAEGCQGKWLRMQTAVAAAEHPE